MQLVRLVYVSKVSSSDFDTKELADIRKKSEANNSGGDITGALAFGNDCFLQCIEGGRTAVNKLYTKISTDPRHSDVLLLGYEDISTRSFAEWSMKVILLTEEKKTIVKKHSITSNFEPYIMSSKSAHSLLCDLAL